MNPIARVFDHRVRGFRVIEVAALACLVLLVFWVYLSKARAGDERSRIAKVEAEISAEQRKVRLLTAEAAHLEQPGRIGALAEAYTGLAPVSAKREADPDALPEIARKAPAPAPAPAPKPVEPAAEETAAAPAGEEAQ